MIIMGRLYRPPHRQQQPVSAGFTRPSTPVHRQNATAHSPYPSPGGRGRALAEPGYILEPDIQAQALESEWVAEDAAMVDGAVGADLGDQGRVDEGGVEDVAAPPRRGEAHALPRVAGCGRGEVLGDLPGGIRAQRYGPADRAQPAILIVAAEDEELRAGQGAGDRADDRLGGVPSSLVKSWCSNLALFAGLDDSFGHRQGQRQSGTASGSGPPR
ncbi:hypothetical protein AB0O22_17095 [Streptomyces sp. NPDC091204]|uniref:hypothetical protein n=1 Tax=Streptomyces sp. NPDC091204 TaxID=3155299 RepID=UPI00341C3D7A